MDSLLAAVARGRRRIHRRAWVTSAALGIALVASGGWHLARGDRIRCAVPEGRLAEVWTGLPGDAHLARLGRAFLAGGAQAEPIWHRLTAMLDNYIADWRAMYLEACEATHLRGEQSEEILDLRMTCLTEELDQLQSLTHAIEGAGADGKARSIVALRELPPVSRCADVPALRSVVPLPRDPATVAGVRAVRRSLSGIDALRQIGRYAEARDKAAALRPAAGALKYQPVAAELELAIGELYAVAYSGPDAEAALERAFILAHGAGDDLTAARAAGSLVYTVAYIQRRYTEGERWARVAEASLRRVGPSTLRTRTQAWLLNDLASVRLAQGNRAGAKVTIDEAIRLKTHIFGPDHPDVAGSLSTLSGILLDLRDFEGALATSGRAIEILNRHDDTGSARMFGAIYNKGEALAALGRWDGAAGAFERSLRLLDENPLADGSVRAYPLTGLGETLKAAGRHREAIDALEAALRIGEQAKLADLLERTRLLLAQTLWESGGDRLRARALARTAQRGFAARGEHAEAHSAQAWLAAGGALGI